MNGSNSSLKDEIKKSLDDKQKQKFKFAASLILSNIMVAALCLSFSETPKMEAAKKIERVLHPEHQIMIVPLSALLVEDHESTKEVPVTLVTRDQKTIAPKAYLHQLAKKNEDTLHFKIEINNRDIAKVTASFNEGVVAIPYVEQIKREKRKYQESKYEVSL